MHDLNLDTIGWTVKQDPGFALRPPLRTLTANRPPLRTSSANPRRREAPRALCLDAGEHYDEYEVGARFAGVIRTKIDFCTATPTPIG